MADALTETQIWMAWRTAFADFADPVPVAWPAEPFAPDTERMFYAVGFTAAPPRRLMLGKGPHVRDGFFTASVVAPVGPPLAWHIQKAAEIVDAFAEDIRIGDCWLRITRRAEIMASYNDGPFIRTPVVIPWQAAA